MSTGVIVTDDCEAAVTEAGPDALLAAEAAVILGAEDIVVTPLAHGQRIGVTAGVWRVIAAHGQAVAKVVSPGQGRSTWRGSHDPHNYRYWVREPMLYDAGLPAGYGEAGIVLPTLLGRFKRPAGDVSLWLQDVSGAGG